MTISIGSTYRRFFCYLLTAGLLTAFTSQAIADEKKGSFHLPPAPIPSAEQSIVGIAKIKVTAFAFSGNQVFSDQELEQLTQPFVNQFLSIAQLIEISQLLTRYYIDQGYINSGAILTDQKVQDGVIHYQIVEGQLSRIEMSGHEGIDQDYLMAGLNDYGHTINSPLNLFSLQNSLKLLQQNPLIETVDAGLEPGLTPGESHLHLKLKPAKAYALNFRMDNHRSPSIGAVRGHFELKHLNFLGSGEQLYLNYGVLDDSDDYFLKFSVPLTANNTRAGISVQRDSSSVLSEPFNSLGFKSDLTRFALHIDHRLLHRLEQELSLGLQFEVTRNETQLLGEPFAFPPGVAKAKVNELSILLNWVKRDSHRVLALTGDLGFGLPGMGATERGGELPDGRYVRWNAQFQWLQSLPFWDAESLFKMNMQLTNENLLSMNQFAVGGANTVRGYRENTLVRDNGVVASWEMHFPLKSFVFSPPVSEENWDNQVKLITFVDYGYAWNHQDFLLPSEQIYSVGLGLAWKLDKHLSAEVYWGKDLKKTDVEYDSNIQDDGIHLQLVLNLF